MSVDGTSFPNLALMKIARWHKMRNDTVEWYSPFERYDKLYMSKVFTHKPDYQYCITNVREIIKGGTGYDIHSVLPEEIDRLQPDYSMYPDVPKDTAYGFLTRGCPNKCKWCVVPQKEGFIHPYMDVDDISIENRTKLILMDNNIVAIDYGLEQIEKIISRKYRIDFNQAIDARLITPPIAEMLVKVRWLDGYIRLGCDTHKQMADCERVIELMTDYGYTGTFLLYTMLHGTMEECYERTSYWRTKFNNKVRCQAQPMLDFTKQKQDIPKWQTAMARWCNRRWFYSATDFMEFEYAKGRYGKEFF